MSVPVRFLNSSRRGAEGVSTRDSIVVAALFVAAVACSYGFFRLGEPQSVWLWRDILGIGGTSP